MMYDRRRLYSTPSTLNKLLFRFPRQPFQDLIDDGSLAAYKLIYGMAQVLCQRQRTVNQQYSEATSEEPGEKSAIRRRLDTLLDSYTISE